MERRRFIVRLLRSDGPDVRARILARFGADGELLRDVYSWDVRVLNEGMRTAPADTLWSVCLASDAPKLTQELSSPRTSLGSLLATTAIHRNLTGHIAPSILAPPPHLPVKIPNRGDRVKETDEAFRDLLGTQGSLQREFVVREAVRLVTGLVHDLPDAAAVRSALNSSGIPVELGSAPDFVALDEDEWIRSLGWPVRDGRLHAPSSTTNLVLDAVRLGRPQQWADRRILGVTILPASESYRATRILDWRTDEQVMADAEGVAALFRKTSVRGRIDGLDEVPSISDALAPPALSPREVVRLRRFIEVAGERGRLPLGFASLLPDMDKLQGLIDSELADRRRALLSNLEAEIEAERLHRARALEGLRAELADAERAIVLLRAREETHRRVTDELRIELAERVDRRVAELMAEYEDRMTTCVERSRVDQEKLGSLSAQVGKIEAAFGEDRRTVRERTADLVRETLEDERTVSMLAGRVAGALPRDDRVATDLGGPACKPDLLIDDPAAAAASLRWHARDNGIEERALHTAFSVASVGLLPIFVGATAGEAAVALARAVGGPTFSTLHCDPTLIAVADLLDPKRARTDALLLAIETARRNPERWYAVALTSIDWAPCAYWLPALGSRRSGCQEVPQNLLIVGATAADGPRTHIPLGALRNAVPLDAAGWSGRNDAPQIAGAWWAGAPAHPHEADEGWADYLEHTIGRLDAELSATSLRLIVGSAKAGRERLHWTAEEACASLSFVAEWLSVVRDGAALPLNVGAMMKKFVPKEEVYPPYSCSPCENVC